MMKRTLLNLFGPLVLWSMIFGISRSSSDPSANPLSGYVNYCAASGPINLIDEANSRTTIQELKNIYQGGNLLEIEFSTDSNTRLKFESGADREYLEADRKEKSLSKCFSMLDLIDGGSDWDAEVLTLDIGMGAFYTHLVNSLYPENPEAAAKLWDQTLTLWSDSKGPHVKEWKDSQSVSHTEILMVCQILKDLNFLKEITSLTKDKGSNAMKSLEEYKSLGSSDEDKQTIKGLHKKIDTRKKKLAKAKLNEDQARRCVEETSTLIQKLKKQLADAEYREKMEKEEVTDEYLKRLNECKSLESSLEGNKLSVTDLRKQIKAETEKLAKAKLNEDQARRCVEETSTLIQKLEKQLADAEDREKTRTKTRTDKMEELERNKKDAIDLISKDPVVANILDRVKDNSKSLPDLIYSVQGMCPVCEIFLTSLYQICKKEGYFISEENTYKSPEGDKDTYLKKVFIGPIEDAEVPLSSTFTSSGKDIQQEPPPL